MEYRVEPIKEGEKTYVTTAQLKAISIPSQVIYALMNVRVLLK